MKSIRKTSWAIRLIWIGATGLLALLWRAEALIFLVGLVFLGPLLRESGIDRDADERETMLHMQAGYYGFLSAIFTIFIVMSWIFFVEQKNPNPAWYLALIIPLLVRGSFYTWKNTGLRRLGLGLGFTFGTIWTLFALISHGFSVPGFIEATIGLSILAAALASLRWPRLGGSLLLAFGLGAALFFTPRWIKFAQPFTAAVMVCLLPFPLILSGISLIKSGIDSDGNGEFYSPEHAG